MQWILNITLAVELVLAVVWTVIMARETGSSGIAVLGWFAIAVVASTAAVLAGAFAAWRQPRFRRRAALVMAMPFIAGVAPALLRGLAGGPLSTAALRNVVLVAVGGIIGIGLLFPRRAVRWLPHGLFRSRGWNLFLIISLGLAWALLMGGAGWLLTAGGQNAMRTATRSGLGEAAAALVLLASSYILLLGVGSALTGAWGWLGLRGGVVGARRHLHLLQCAGAAPGILVAAATWAWLVAQR